MMEGLRDILGVLMILGALLLIRRVLSPQKPPTKRRRSRPQSGRTSARLPGSGTDGRWTPD
jgi:hypothetical protein